MRRGNKLLGQVGRRVVLVGVQDTCCLLQAPLADYYILVVPHPAAATPRGENHHFPSLLTTSSLRNDGVINISRSNRRR